jgi:hypothetical protein
MDFGGGDLAQVSAGISAITQCTPLCCNMTGCVGFTFAAAAAAHFGNCVRGKPCCYLKKTIGKPRAASEYDCASVETKPTPGVKWESVKWEQHPGGYWKNLGTDDKASGASMKLCAAKCIATPNCAGFEVYDVGQKDAGCYTFVGMLEQPFTPNDACSTCIRVN